MSPHQLSIAGQALQLVANHFQLTLRDLESHRRTWRLVWPRWCAIALIKRTTTLSKSDIALILGRDHGTICHALIMLDKQIETSLPHAREFTELEAGFLEALQRWAWTEKLDHPIPISKPISPRKNQRAGLQSGEYSYKHQTAAC